MVAGVLAAILWVVVGIGSLSDEIDGFQRVPLGRSGEVSFSEPGGYVIYYEGDAFPGFNADVEPLDGGRAEAPVEYGGDLTYDMGGRSGRAVGTIRILQPGRFTFDTTSTPDAGGRLAVGPTIARRLVLVVVGALALAFGGGIIGATTLIVTALKRYGVRSRRVPGPRR